MKKKWMLLVFALLIFRPAFAEIKTEVVEYRDGGSTLQGYLAYDDSIKDRRPGILVVHEWNGLGHYVESRCKQLAKLGWVAFAPDIYGKGVRPDTFESCQKESTKYKTDRSLMRRRAQAGLAILQKNPRVAADKIIAIGYCFGGTVALELGRAGAPLAGIVSFHGGLDNPNPKDAKNIKAAVLICQGGADNFTLAQVPGFKKEMDDSKVNYKFVSYKGAVHGFTNPENKGTVPGLKYDAKADKKSWKDMVRFINGIFKDQKKLNK